MHLSAVYERGPFTLGMQRFATEIGFLANSLGTIIWVAIYLVSMHTERV